MKAIIMVGGPASGKSTVVAQRFSYMRVINSDDFKTQHPDYNPEAPELVHAWSRRLAVKAVYQAMVEEVDFVYDSTGANVERLVDVMAQAGSQGYEVTIVYVPCDIRTALERNAQRDRKVPEWVVRDRYATVLVAVEILSRYADRVEVIR
jgi:predicted ABC-type ATPase